MKPMQSRKIQPAKDRKQVEAFRKAARELGGDESDERFKETLRTLAKQRPKSTQGRKLKTTD